MIGQYRDHLSNYQTWNYLYGYHLALAHTSTWCKKYLLHGLISKDIYMEQPPQMKNPQYSSHVCKLQKAFYGLK